MTHLHSQGEVRPSGTSSSFDELGFDEFGFDELGALPLLRLRTRDRTVIPPEECLVVDCLICQWRLDGLLDAPDKNTPVLYSPRSQTRVVRDGTLTLDWGCYCPGCGARIGCRCDEWPDEPEEDTEPAGHTPLLWPDEDDGLPF